MLTRLKTLCGKGQDQGFTLIELLIVVLIVGILAAVATPIYLGYIRDAKAAEGKAIAGSVWTAVQSNGIGGCGVAAAVSQAYSKAGLTTTGATNPARWSVSAGGANTLTVTCADGTYNPSAALLFTLSGTAADVTSIQIALHYLATQTPPSVLRCTTDGTAVSATSPTC